MNIFGYQVTATDVVLLIGFVWTGVQYLAGRNKLPVSVQKALDTIGFERIKGFINNAADMSHKTPAARREFVVLQIISYCEQHGIVFPESFLRMALEYVFARWRGKF